MPSSVLSLYTDVQTWIVKTFPISSAKNVVQAQVALLLYTNVAIPLSNNQKDAVPFQVSFLFVFYYTTASFLTISKPRSTSSHLLENMNCRLPGLWVQTSPAANRHLLSVQWTQCNLTLPNPVLISKTMTTIAKHSVYTVTSCDTFN